MSRIEILDLVLNEIYIHHQPDTFWHLDRLLNNQLKDESRIELKSILQELIDSGLAFNGSSGVWALEISKKGIEITEKYGSYSKYIEAITPTKETNTVNINATQVNYSQGNQSFSDANFEIQNNRQQDQNTKSKTAECIKKIGLIAAAIVSILGILKALLELGIFG